ncbi:hypothetical protein [Actinacidiphila glaucinigra]|uniref:hypothetical protein n=1 Tax=Actinacidiphila glaucinigra TaxID=235986 RepID=UPI0035D6F374
MTPPEQSALTAELSNLRSEVGNVGRDVGDIKTACAVLVERSNRTEQDVRDLRQDMETEFRKVRDDELKPLRAELEVAKSRRWPLQTITALTAVAGAATGAVALFIQH